MNSLKKILFMLKKNLIILKNIYEKIKTKFNPKL